MAEEDAEIALLHKMQADQERVAWDGGADDAVYEGVLPSNTENSDQDQEVQESFAVSDDQSINVLSPSASGIDTFSPSLNGAPGGDAPFNTLSPFSSGVSIPLADKATIPAKGSTNILRGLSPAMPVTRAPNESRMPRKTVGGFLADDSDDDEANDSQKAPISRRNNMDNPHPSGDRNARVAQSSPVQELTPNTSGTSGSGLTAPKARLPHDRVGILEDRIKEDPRGDLDAWLSLISEHRRRNKLDDARAVYERFFKVFPSAADIWVAYAEMELSNDNFYAAEQIFGKSLPSVPNVQLWSVYLNYIRRRNDLTNDPTGAARAIVSQAYDFVLANIGMDRDSGKIWQEYIHFIRSAPGQIGGSSWQDQQKMDQMRKAYQRATSVPMSNIVTLWKEYDQFELALNKLTARKFLQERSPSYITARSANTAMENITRGLVRTNLPRLPPALGFEGDQEYLQQVELWRRWIKWEQEDPLVLKDEDIHAYQQRVLYTYKQAVMALRFWPEIWLEAAEWCFANGIEKDGTDQGMEFLAQGIAANPESCLLAFKHADRLESILPVEDKENEEGLARSGAAIREPYDRLHNALYDLIKKVKARETTELAKIEESASLDATISAVIQKAEEDDEDAVRIDQEAKDIAKAKQLKAVQEGYATQLHLLSRTISFSWIALMRAMRRVQGKGGKGGKPVSGSRLIFADARARGRITSDVYVASALIEHTVYKDPAGTRIFEKGAKLFPEDEVFILEYLKHLLSIGDITNARAVFETSVNRLAQKPELLVKAKPLYAFFHKYEADYGELSQIKKLEQRMADLFPEDPKLLRFSARFSNEGFDPIAVRPIISPATQMRPKAVMQSIEHPMSIQNSPRPQYRQEASPRPQFRQEPSPRPTYLHGVTNSPKRPLGEEDEIEASRPRKVPRGESPLKGAAGRRLNQQKQMQAGAPVWQSHGPAPFSIPRDITFLLSIIPRAETYTSTRFNPEAMVRLLAQTDVPDYGVWKIYNSNRVPLNH